MFGVCQTNLRVVPSCGRSVDGLPTSSDCWPQHPTETQSSLFFHLFISPLSISTSTLLPSLSLHSIFFSLSHFPPSPFTVSSIFTQRCSQIFESYVATFPGVCPTRCLWIFTVTKQSYATALHGDSAPWMFVAHLLKGAYVKIFKLFTGTPDEACFAVLRTRVGTRTSVLAGVPLGSLCVVWPTISLGLCVCVLHTVTPISISLQPDQHHMLVSHLQPLHVPPTPRLPCLVPDSPPADIGRIGAPDSLLQHVSPS